MATDRIRPELVDLPSTMKAIVTTGVGGYERLVYRDVPVPRIGPGDVLLQVLAAGVNNNEINTRLGWYSSSITTSTEEAAEAEDGTHDVPADGGWGAATPFPFIQGTDCCGRVVAVAPDCDTTLIGARVIVRACMRPHGFGSTDMIWMGSDFDGAFAQFVKVPASEVFRLDCDWSDAELATIPCAYATAENMLQRAGVAEGMRVLISGASGGVGSAAVQLAKRRGAKVVAIAGADKIAAVRAIGADSAVERQADVATALGTESVDVVVDMVAGPAFGGLLSVLRRGGTYVSSGAIGGPMVVLDMRTLYLKDLTLIGCTAWDEPVFANLVSYIERGEIRPLLAGTFPLAAIAEAQQTFLAKKHVGKIVLVPPPLGCSRLSWPCGCT